MLGQRGLLQQLQELMQNNGMELQREAEHARISKSSALAILWILGVVLKLCSESKKQLMLRFLVLLFQFKAFPIQLKPLCPLCMLIFHFLLQELQFALLNFFFQ